MPWARRVCSTGRLATNDHSTPAALHASSTANRSESASASNEVTALRSSTNGFSVRTKRRVYSVARVTSASLSAPVIVTTVANWRQCARISAPLQLNVGLPYIAASLDHVLEQVRRRT